MGNILSELKKRYVDEPADIGEAAYREAMERLGEKGEGSRADAAKHMAWQAALAQRTSPVVANVLGVGKELVVDGLGSLLNGDNPIPVLKNSIMDMRNNYEGASRLEDSTDIVNDAVELARRARHGSLWDALRDAEPYYTKKAK